MEFWRCDSKWSLVKVNEMKEVFGYGSKDKKCSEGKNSRRGVSADSLLWFHFFGDGLMNIYIYIYIWVFGPKLNSQEQGAFES